MVEFVGWWLVLDFAETKFASFVTFTMPNYRERLKKNGELRKYQSNAPALLNSTVCSLLAIAQIYSGGWAPPMVLIVYCCYDTARGCRRVMVFHHCVALMLLKVSTTEFGHEVAPYILISELSTVPLCLLSILKGTNKTPRTLTVVWERQWVQALKEIFFIVFLGTRIILPVSPLLYLWAVSPGAIIALAPLVMLNYYWFIQMVTKCLILN